MHACENRLASEAVTAASRQPLGPWSVKGLIPSQILPSCGVHRATSHLHNEEDRASPVNQKLVPSLSYVRKYAT